MTNKTYSFNLVTPKRFKNRKIKFKANSAKEAKELILQDLHKINKRFVKVYEMVAQDYIKAKEGEQQ